MPNLTKVKVLKFCYFIVLKFEEDDEGVTGRLCIKEKFKRNERILQEEEYIDNGKRCRLKDTIYWNFCNP